MAENRLSDQRGFDGFEGSFFFLGVSVQSDRLHQSSDTLTHDQCLSCESESSSAMPAETLDAIGSEPWMANDPVIVRDWHAYSFALRVPNLLPVA